MNSPRHLFVVLLLSFLAVSASLRAADEIRLQLKKTGEQAEVGVHARLKLPVSALYPEYVIEQSSDLKEWTPVAGPFSGSVGVSDELLRVPVPAAGPGTFYRAVASVKVAVSGSGMGDAIYGYGTAFSQQLRELGQLPLDQFVSRYQVTNQYLPQVTFDPRTADFWSHFNADPAQWNATNTYEARRLLDYRLNPAELAVLQTNGFVVSQRMERRSFADVYYDLYTDDLPVFVTTDSILQAWHRSLVTMVSEIEETYLSLALADMLTAMSGQVSTLWAEALSTPMASGVKDADYFLAVAQSLITGSTTYGYLAQQARVTETMTALSAYHQGPFKLFGEDRLVDFSQMKVRGHYANSVQMQRYFKAMMWCALADFRYAGFSDGVTSGTNSLRELQGAVALEMLLRRAGKLEEWQRFNRTLEMLVGTPDSLTVAQLNALLSKAGISSPADLPTVSAWTNLQGQLMSGDLGLQQITSGYYYSPLGPGQVKLPRSFSFMGQRFVMDSWALAKSVFDSIIWDENGVLTLEDKVMRRVPSALDVAFSVLGNSQVTPELAARISRTNLTPANGREYWRDGRPYQHNLAAVRNVIDSQNPGAWTNSVYNYWLSCLRLLSEPTTDACYPEVMRTRPWAMKTLNTQLASWTHLRYTTALYVRESYTPILLCLYPKGYVEPRPAFWARMGEMAAATRSVLALLPTNVVFSYTHYGTNGKPYVVSVSAAAMYTNRLALMDHFSSTMEILRSISEKELNRTPFSEADNTFLKRLVEFNYYGARTYTGWYPGLFYQPGREYIPPSYQTEVSDSGDEKGSDFWDPLVTTVHTDSPDGLVGDPGSILHQAVGNVHLMLIAVDNGPGDLAIYGAPVLSHYEFELEPSERLTDADWKTRVTNNTLPATPEWTRSFLVPK